MKKSILVILFPFVVSFAGCGVDSDSTISKTETPKIYIIGKKTDTTYLYGSYKDEGAFVIYEKNGRFLREEIIGKGSVNTASLGAYFIDYDYADSLGNHSATATRTIYVVEHKLAYLNGNYDVACSCTVTSDESGKTEQIKSTYTAEVSTSSNSNDITLKYLRVGPEDLQPNTTLKGDSIIISYYSRDLQLSNGNCGNGYLLPDKNSFVINSLARPFSIKKTYVCRNTFTKKLKLKIQENK